MAINPAAAAPIPIPAFAPVESPEGGAAPEGVAEPEDVAIEEVGVGVAGAYQRARSVLCHAI